MRFGDEYSDEYDDEDDSLDMNIQATSLDALKITTHSRNQVAVATE